MFRIRARATLSAVAVAGVISLALAPTAAMAATTIDGPIDLGTAAPFAVLASSTVTNTGTSVINGAVGLSPGTAIEGFPPGVINGPAPDTGDVAAQAQVDLTTAYNVAAGLTPMTTGLGDLTDSSLTPGVYSGNTLSLTGEMTLDGEAESVWVFQAASTLTIGSGATITMTGGASACNVFWQVGSSATIGSGAQFVGTVMADISVTANTTATIEGRLLARTGAVTLDTNLITAPTGCAPAGTVRTSPEITSAAPPTGQVGASYEYALTATGTPTPTYTVVDGALPPGLTLDSVTGVLSGQPTDAGTYSVTVSVSNGALPDATASYVITVAAAQAVTPPVAPRDGDAAGELAESGIDLSTAPVAASVVLILGGLLALTLSSRQRRMMVTR